VRKEEHRSNLDENCCWAQAYFEKKGCFEHRHNFGEEGLFLERPNFGKEYLILEHMQLKERKKHIEKEGKVACKRKRNVARRQRPNHVRVRVLDNDYNHYKPKN
jgi:hypothetical protein